MNYIIVDFEMNPVAKEYRDERKICRCEIIEIGAVIMDERIMSLEKALNYAGIEFEGHMHDALCDAKNTAELFAIVRNEERCNVVLKAVMEVLKPKNISSTLGDMIDFGALMAQLA